jgi:hypothetical protein
MIRFARGWRFPRVLRRCRGILLAFAAAVDLGYCQSFPDAGETPGVPQVDATLWYSKRYAR